MTSIGFYFNAEDRLQLACRLAGKAFALKKSLVVYAPDGATAQRFDRMLWTVDATGFIPHCFAEDSIAGETPVVIARDETAPPGANVLLNLSEDCPPHFARFERLLEVCSREGEDRPRARERYRFYRERGYPIENHDMQARRGAG